MKRFPRTMVVVAALSVLAVSCGEDDGADVRDDASGSASGGSASGGASGSETAECEPFGDPDTFDSEIDVTLDEWSIDAPATVDAGAVKMNVTNDGVEPHELVVVRADSVADLPTDDEGAIDEEAIAEEDFIGEIEPFPGGEACEGVFELEAGNYVFFCAIVEDHDGTTMDHFAEGMSRVVTVE